jgi:hypothetical protein
MQNATDLISGTGNWAQSFEHLHPAPPRPLIDARCLPVTADQLLDSAPLKVDWLEKERRAKLVPKIRASDGCDTGLPDKHCAHGLPGIETRLHHLRQLKNDWTTRLDELKRTTKCDSPTAAHDELHLLERRLALLRAEADPLEAAYQRADTAAQEQANHWQRLWDNAQQEKAIFVSAIADASWEVDHQPHRQDARLRYSSLVPRFESLYGAIDQYAQRYLAGVR